MEIPSIKRTATKQNSKNFRIVSVTIDEEKVNWLKAVTEENMSWQQLFIPLEKKQQTSAQYNLGLIPQIYLVNNKNKIVKKVIGSEEGNEEKIQTFIDQYLSKN